MTRTNKKQRLLNALIAGGYTYRYDYLNRLTIAIPEREKIEDYRIVVNELFTLVYSYTCFIVDERELVIERKEYKK